MSGSENAVHTCTYDLPFVMASDLAAPIRAPTECGDGLRFGASTTCTNSLVMISDDGRRDGPPRSGIVCTYGEKKDGWALIDTLHHPVPRSGDEFGAALDCDNDQLIVGSPGDGMGGTPGGEAWIFTRASEGWIAESRLAVEGLPSGSRFGETVAIHGNYAAVGTPRYDSDGLWDRGRVDVFTRTAHGWKSTSTLEPSQKMSSMWFGKSLSFCGPNQSLFIGAPGFDTPSDRAGAVFHAKRNTKGCWNIHTRIQAHAPVPLERMGMSITGEGNSLFVGSPGSDKGGHYAGSILHIRNGFAPSIIGEYFSPPYPNARLGVIVESSKKWIAASMPGAQHTEGIGNIRMYRIHTDQIQPVCQMYSRDTEPPLGQSISMNRQYLIVSGIYPEDDYPQSGCVWILKLSDFNPWTRGSTRK